MNIVKGLIIAEPWISKILKGEKTWEMRSENTKIRGPIALIRKGSGLVVGVANLIDVHGQFSNAELATTIDKHHVGPDLFTRADYKWRRAWELNGAIPLKVPVPYIHKNGAVKWVNLDSAATDGIRQEFAEAMNVAHTHNR